MELNRGTILAICTSSQRGTAKKEVECAEVKTDWGIVGDAHAGHWHRQISLLSAEKIEAFRSRGAEVAFGAFGENLVVSGFDFRSLPVGTRFQIGDALLEMTQIGKDCHSHCAIYKVMGDCIMPREGVFARVLRDGWIHKGEEITMLPYENNGPLTAAVITLSDKGAAGKREDKSGPVIVEELKKRNYDIIETLLLPDEQKLIEKELKRLADQRQVNLILTTGGTGFSPRDCTPEATMAVATRNAPGIAEAMRAESMRITPKGMLSREASVIRNRTLIINMPGSPKAVRECLAVILDPLEHGLNILLGRDGECGSNHS